MLVNNLKEHRTRLGLSQVKLGALVLLAPSLISDFERGARQPWPRARRLFAKVLGVAEEVLFPPEESGHEG